MREAKTRVYKTRCRRWIIKSYHTCDLKFNKNSFFLPRIWFFLHTYYMFSKEWCKFPSQAAHDIRLSWRCLWKFYVFVLVKIHRSSRRTWCLSFHVRRNLRDIMFHRSFGMFVPNHTSSHHKTQLFSKSVSTKYGEKVIRQTLLRRSNVFG